MRDFWRRFRRNIGAVFGLAILVGVVLLAAITAALIGVIVFGPRLVALL